MKAFFAAGLVAATAWAYQIESNEHHELQMPVGAAPTWAAGLIYGMVGVNNLTEIEACANDGWSEIQDIEVVIQDFAKGDYSKGAEELVAFAKGLETVLHDCTAMKDDISAIKSWAEIFSDKTHLIATVSKNLLLHRRKIKADIAEVEQEWHDRLFFKSGTTAADLAYYAIGPIH